MFQKTIFAGNRAAVITSNDESGPFSVRIWVNARDGLHNADATLVAAKRATLAGAVKWARDQLEDRTGWLPGDASGFVNLDHD